jgi:hypothetical protein
MTFEEKNTATTVSSDPAISTSPQGKAGNRKEPKRASPSPSLSATTDGMEPTAHVSPQRPAKRRMKPSKRVPGATHPSWDRRATKLLRPTAPSLGETSSASADSDDHGSRETHGMCVVTDLSPSGDDRTITRAEPNKSPSGRIHPAQPGDEATEYSKPIRQAPRRKHSPKGEGVGQGTSEPHTRLADANPSPDHCTDANHRTGEGGGSDGQASAETQTPGAVAATNARKGRRAATVPAVPMEESQSCPDIDGQLGSETQLAPAVEADDGAHQPSETQSSGEPVIGELIQLTRMRRRWIAAKNKLVLQGKAIGRQWAEGGDKVEGARLFESAKAGEPVDPYLLMSLTPFLAALPTFENDIERIEKQLDKMGKSLPVWKTWGQHVKGLSSKGLAIIVGECGDIGSYRNPSCVWKRMGLAVHFGHRQGNPGTGATADDWTFEAYSKHRRSVMWNVGNSLIGGMGKFRPAFGEEDSPDWSAYQKLFVDRCRYEAARLPHKDGSAIKESATGKESYTAHAAARAKRHVEKRLLRDLYAAWRQASIGANPTQTPPVSTNSEEADCG